MEIDEEGQVTVLTVLRSNDRNRVLFRVAKNHGNAIALEGITARSDLGEGLGAELRRFFTSEFDPEHWDRVPDAGTAFLNGPGVGMAHEAGSHVEAKDRVLGHPWIANAS